MQITVTDTHGKSHILAFEEGDNLMQLLTDQGFDEVLALCGGSCSCATCHVHIIAGTTEYPAEANEIDLLELADNYDEALSRLSCQLQLSYMNDGMSVQLVSTS